MSDLLQPALTDSHYDAALDAAREIGEEEGKHAASWVFDGNTPEDAYRRILAGLNDGDAEILDELPSADLSGQWADGRTPSTLAADIASRINWTAGTRYTRDDVMGEDAGSGICDAYEGAFNNAVCAEVERMARAHLDA